MYVTDYSDVFPGDRYLTYDVNDADVQDIFVSPVVRVWSAGYLVQTVKLENSLCDGSYDWWHVLDINGAGVASSVNTCFDQTSVNY